MAKISFCLNGEKKVHRVVMDARHIFLEDLRKRFFERVGHEEDMLVATALDPR